MAKAPRILRRKDADEEEKRKPPANVYAVLPVEGAPPPPSPIYGVKDELAQIYPEHVVTFDSGAFMTVWRAFENKALLAHNSPTRDMHPEVYDALLRIVTALRRSNDALTKRLEEPRRKRVIGRR